MTIVQSSLFDYMQLDTETRIVVQQRTEEIKVLVRRSAQDIIDIGSKLIDVKARLGHGNFGGWLESEFGWSVPSAARFMQVAAKFGDIQIYQIDKFGASALYLLSAPSTPEPARIEAIERAQAGETITHATAQQIVTEHKPVDRSSFIQSIVPEPTVDTVEPVSYEEHAEELAGDEEAYDWADDELEDSITEEFDTPDTIVERNAFISSEVVTKPHVANNSGDNEWYTPAHIIEAARSVMGGIDLDPASNDIANGVVKAATYYTVDDDGLSHQWSGRV